jgi:predicted transcriptional regulator
LKKEVDGLSTKHERILKYIAQLEIGEKISVRQIAKKLQVSDGTAYRAIKEAENQGLVQTIDRVGTVRIEKKRRSNLEQLTFAEVVNIVNGTVLGGKNGLHKQLNRFVIGAMKLEAMMRYIHPGNLLIVGNRDQVHRIALKRGAAVLITGGFHATEEVRRLADQLGLPVISSSYDTFTVASLINRAIYDHQIKKEILLVEDVFSTESKPVAIQVDRTVADFYRLSEKTGYRRFPVVDHLNRVVGMVTSKDVRGFRKEERIERVMTKNPIVVFPKNSLASAAHELSWEGVELLPVVNEKNELIGVLSRQDVIQSLQTMYKQPEIGETLQELSYRGFQEIVNEDGESLFCGKVTPQMTDSLGTLSVGVLTSLISETASRYLRRLHHGNLTVKEITLYVLKLIQLESTISIVPRVLEMGRKQTKLEIEVRNDQQVAAKALLTAQMINKYY